ncbi:unnamed protein product, partial [Vitis vinifera]
MGVPLERSEVRVNEMGRRRRVESDSKSQTLPSSPSHSFSSSSSSDFEFTVSQSPLKSSSNHLCPADELFYKGQLLPLHLSPRLSMVRTLLLASSSTASSSSDTTTTASRDSTGSSTESTSSFCQQQKMGTDTTAAATLSMKSERSIKDVTGISVQNSGNDSRGGGFSHSFSGNLRYPRRRRCVSSCPSSMRSSPSHSGVLCRNMYASTGRTGGISHMDSTMEELQSAIQGAIAHCKNSMAVRQIILFYFKFLIFSMCGWARNSREKLFFIYLKKKCAEMGT